MSARRFEVTLVSEPNPPSKPSEIIPLMHIENEIPPPPPLPTSIVSVDVKDPNRMSSKLFNTVLRRKSFDTRRRATVAAAVASTGQEMKKSSSADIIPKTESLSPSSNATYPGNAVEDSDVYSTIQSNNNDTTHPRINNKFLQELRLKRRELHEKSKNLPIDQRIAFHRRQNQRTIVRAQDIFDVHFELNDDEDILPLPESNFFTEESQEKIRTDIYNELDRQRKKQDHKHHQHLLLGRALLMFMTSLIAFMSFTLIYVVLDLYDRAHYLDMKLPENEFIPMIYDTTTGFS